MKPRWGRQRKSVNKTLIVLGTMVLVAGNLQLSAALAAQSDGAALGGQRQSLPGVLSTPDVRTSGLAAPGGEGGPSSDPPQKGPGSETESRTEGPSEHELTAPDSRGSDAGAAADLGALSVEIHQVTPNVQAVGLVYEYVIEFSCLSRVVACENVAIELPLNQTTPLASGAAPMSEWHTELISADESLLAGQESWQFGEQIRSAALLKPLDAGSSGSFRILLRLPRGLVANETTWELQPRITASNANPGIAPVAEVSEGIATANWRFSSRASGAEGIPAGVGFTAAASISSTPFGDEPLFQDKTKPRWVSLSFPPEIEMAASLPSWCTESKEADVTVVMCPGVEWTNADEVWAELTLRVKPDTPIGTVAVIQAAGAMTLIGEDEERSGSETHKVLVVKDTLYGSASVFLAGNTNANRIVSTAETTKPVRASTQASAQRIPTVVSKGIQLPCLSPRSQLIPGRWYPNPDCLEPLVTAQSVSVRVYNMDDPGPISVAVTLASGEQHVLDVGAEPVSLAAWGGQVVGVRLKDYEFPSFDAGAESWTTPWLELIVDAVLPVRPELTHNDTLVFTGDAEVRSALDPDDFVRAEGRREITFNEGILGAAIKDLRVIDGWTWGDRNVLLGAGAGFLAPLGERYDSRAVSVLLPPGLRPDNPEAVGAEVIEDFRGTGRTLVRVVGSDWESSVSYFLRVDSRSIDPGLYTYDIYHGFAGYEATTCESNYQTVEPQALESGLEDIFAEGESGVGCHATLPLLVKGAQTGHSVVKSVRGDGDQDWVAAPGTTAVTQDGSGSAAYRLQWANTGPTQLHGVAVYDVLPAPGDSGSVGAFTGLPRGSDFAVTYESVTVPDGFTAAYSVSENPCRPELGGEDASCVDDWSLTPPASLADVRALRFTADAPMTGGSQAEFLIGVNVPAIEGGQVAVNTVAAGGALENGRVIPAVESAFVGVGAELRDAEIVVAKSADVPESVTVKAGDRVSYSIEVRNDGGVPGAVKLDDVIAGVMDDATLVEAPTVSGSESVTATAFDDVIELRGALAAGEAATVSYTVEVSAADARDDHSLRNFVVAAGEAAGEVCLPENLTCTQHEVSELELRKSADPKSGTVVTPGATVTYGLEVENLGADTELTLTDLLAGVLDDAELVGDVSVTPDSVTAAVVGDELVVSGTLAAGESATVSYGVRVKEAAAGGDRMLRNWFVAAGSTLPEKCVADAVNCTVHPVDAGGGTKPPVTIDPPATITPPGAGSSGGGLSETGSGAGAGPVWVSGVLVLLLGVALWRGGRARHRTN